MSAEADDAYYSAKADAIDGHAAYRVEGADRLRRVTEVVGHGRAPRGAWPDAVYVGRVVAHVANHDTLALVPPRGDQGEAAFATRPKPSCDCPMG